MYIVKCQITERPELHYFSGLSDIGEVLFSNYLCKAARYSNAQEAEDFMNSLVRDRIIVRAYIEPEELNR